MGSNKQTTNKQNKNRLVDREQADSPRVGGMGVERTRKKRKGLMDMDNSVVIVGEGDGQR